MNPIFPKFNIGDIVKIKVFYRVPYAWNYYHIQEKEERVKITGMEFGHWLREPDWIYNFCCENYDFTLRVTEKVLLKGCKVHIIASYKAKVDGCENIDAK